MIAEYAIGGVYVAAAPVEACMALIVTLLLHRLLVAGRVYRWVWHPMLFDTALFILAWAVLAAALPALLPGTAA
ncbi:DUF1656 domain-containing protein [Novosphingobium flavum]|uniref:DUF1656 domain-containing protein n=1 Tax=Novosphingobium flavum TaxID=1778672 RepID=A0A7X1FSG3_9SPHN|nr:DUF1656 domain-containing protein [Novosphingobium flavum]MBC2666136.1 DUF1656 domain-containing protein [Novosphingobium flavum]